MSNKTIAKFYGLVILVAAGQMLASSCSHAAPKGRYPVNSAAISSDYAKPEIVGLIESNDVSESSGIAASMCQPDVLWTHNDSGDGAFLYAMDPRGKHLGTWKVNGGKNDDWEDIATFKDAGGRCFVYVGDTGNNDLGRTHLQIYRIPEPTVAETATQSNKRNPIQTDPAEVLTFRYPDTPHDAETLLVHPQTGDIYVLTKRLDGPSQVFKLTSGRAVKVGEVNLPAVPNGLLTGGGISPAGRRVIVCDLSAGYELDLGSATTFDEIWKRQPIPIDLGDRKQGEAVSYSADGGSILATSERKNSPVIQIKRR